MTELPAKLNVPDAVFKLVPRKQPARRSGLRVARRITNEDLEGMIRRRTAVPILSKLGPSLLSELTAGLASRLVNAGPHVVQISVDVAYDIAAESHLIVASTPLIPCKTYGPEVKRSDLVVASRGQSPAEPVATESIWSRVKRWAREIAKDLPYEGPAGFIDQ